MFEWSPANDGFRENKTDALLIFRPSAIKMSSRAYELADIESNNFTHVQINRDSKQFAYQLIFITKPRRDELMLDPKIADSIYELGPDGGRKPKKGPDTRKKTLIASQTIARKVRLGLASDGVHHEDHPRYRMVQHEGVQGWIVQTQPQFTDEATSPKDIPDGLEGIYAIHTKSEGVIYIGEGQIKKRVTDFKLKHADPILKIVYGEVKDKATRKCAEKHHIALYKGRHGGCRPKHNRNDGVGPKGC